MEGGGGDEQPRFLHALLLKTTVLVVFLISPVVLFTPQSKAEQSELR